MGSYSWDKDTPSSGGYSWSGGGGGSSSPSKPAPSSLSKGVNARFGGSSPLGDVNSTLGNAINQGGGIISGIPGAAVITGKSVWHDLSGGKVHDEKLNDWGFLFHHPIAYGQHWLHEPSTFGGAVVKPQIDVVTADQRALRRGDWGYFQRNPLNPILDIASIASLGGKAALPVARTGVLGERAAGLANEPRLLTVGDHTEELSQARTLQGRIRQSIFDRYSMANPDKPVVGANVRMRKILNTRSATETLRASLPVRKFQQVARRLEPGEVFAYHVAAEGVPLDERISYYQAQLAEQTLSGGKTRTISQYLGNLQAPGVADALANPRPEFIDALQQGKALEEAAGKRLVDTGQLTEATRADRAAFPQREMRGEPGVEGPASMDVNLVNPALPAPFRFPHAGDVRSSAKFYKSPSVDQMLGKQKTLGQLKHNAGVRMRNALILTDPERVLTRDYLSTMRHEQILQMKREALNPISKELTGDEIATGFKKPNEWYYRDTSGPANPQIPREVREMEGLSRDLGLLDSDPIRRGSENAAAGIVSRNLKDLGVSDADLHNLDKLKEMGIRRVPHAFGKGFTDQFAHSHWALRHFYDRPLDVWRAITLNFRPAWAVNNFIGNGVMGLARYGPRGATAYLRVLLATEKGDEKVRRLWKYTMRHPTLRRKYGKVFDEVAPQLHSAGLFGTQTKVTHAGAYEGKLANFRANPAVRALGFTPKMIGKGVSKVGRGITKAEILFAEDTSREAAFIREAKGDLDKIRSTARKMGEANLSYAEALKRMDRASVEKAVRGVNDALGDFNDLSTFERGVLRRIIPFYSWYKVITKVSAKYAARYPERLLMIKAISQANQTKGEPKLPDWLDGAIRIGKPTGGVQSVLSTNSVNPYATLPQTAEGGTGLLSPFLSPLIIGTTGVDPTYGDPHGYYGYGHTTRTGIPGILERSGGSFVQSLAPFQLLQHTTEKPSPHSIYSPHEYARVGPFSINDYLLQYLGLPLRHVKVNQ